MSLRQRLARSAVLAAATAAPSAPAQTSITLFGQQYRVQRFDYSQVQLPNIAFPNDPPIPLFEVEGAHYLGNNRLLMSADDIADVAIGNPDNWFVIVELVMQACSVTGLRYDRTIARVDAAADGYDPNPGGVTINTGSTGLGAGGQLVVCGNEGALYGFDFNTGAVLEFPPASGCLSGPPGACNLNISSNNFNAEDAAFVPGSGPRTDAFYVINQDLGGLDQPGVERWSTTGTLLGSFPVGGAVDAGLAGGVAKGITYIRDTRRLPASLQRPDGVLLVSFDRDFPAVQAFDVNGSLIATEYLTVSGTPAAPFRLDMSGCPQRLHLESIAADDATGRLFLVNQGTLLTCNYLWVLTPEACAADVNASGSVTVQDIFDFLASYFAGAPAADINCSGSVTVQDIFDFLALYFAACN